MKWAAFFIFILFSFQIMEVSALPGQTAKTCCGRSICSCDHPKNAACPFKKNLIHKAVTKPHCHLAKTPANHAVKTIKQSQPGKPLFSAAPCSRHSKNTAIAGGGYYKDFYPSENFEHLILTPNFYTRIEEPRFSPSLFQFRIDRPPRF